MPFKSKVFHSEGFYTLELIRSLILEKIIGGNPQKKDYIFNLRISDVTSFKYQIAGKFFTGEFINGLISGENIESFRVLQNSFEVTFSQIVEKIELSFKDSVKMSDEKDATQMTKEELARKIFEQWAKVNAGITEAVKLELQPLFDEIIRQIAASVLDLSTLSDNVLKLSGKLETHIKIKDDEISNLRKEIDELKALVLGGATVQVSFVKKQ